MSDKRITEDSKLIAKYLGWVYVPHNNLGNYKKAGWYRTQERVEEVLEKEGGTINKTLIIDSMRRKKGWDIVDGKYVRFVCRSHNELRFYNSFDALIPAIEKLEKEDLSEFHYEWEDGRGKHNNFMGIRFSRFEDQSDFSIDLQLDPPTWIGEGKGGGIVKDTFKAVVEAIKYINNVKIY